MFEHAQDPASEGSTPEERTSPLTDGVEGFSRRLLLRAGAVGSAGVALTAAGAFGKPYLAQKGLWTADGAFAATSTALGDLLFYIENFPTSPLIINPFNDSLPIPKALRPIQTSPR